MLSSIPLKRLSAIATSAALLAFGVGEVAEAATITNGLTFAVADGFTGPFGVGTHFHSNTAGEFGNPAGKAEVGSLLDEEVRGLSEYDLTGLGSTDSAIVTFEVFNDGGLFASDNDFNDFSFVGDIDLVAYGGNNSEDLSDYQAAEIATVGTFSTAGLSVGDTLSFDLTSIFNNAIATSLPSLGLRLEIAAATDTGGGAWTFENFRLTTNETTPSAPVPEPTSTSALLVLGAFGTGLMMKRKAEQEKL